MARQQHPACQRSRHRALTLVPDVPIPPPDPSCRVCGDRQAVEARFLDSGVTVPATLCPACVWETPTIPAPTRTDHPRGVA